MSSTNMSSHHNARRRRRPLTFAVWRNPLSRPDDRLQAGALVLTFVGWLFGLPCAAVLGSLIWSNISMTAEHELHTRSVITGTLLADAPDLVVSDYGVPMSVVPATAQWMTADGTQRTGMVAAPSGSRAGEPIAIWVDQSGDLTDPPTSTAAGAISTVSSATAIWLAWGVFLVLLWFGLRWRLDRQRATDWGNEWRSVEPVWTGR